MPIESKEEVEYCKLLVNYTAEPGVVIEKRNECLKQLKNMPVSGFRKGKAPNDVLLSIYRKQVDSFVIKELVAHAYDDVLFETGITPIGYPNTSDIQLVGNTFSCRMLFLKKPDFELKQYKDLEIPNPHIQKTETELTEELLYQVRKQFADVVPYGEKDFAQSGDKITMSYELRADGMEPIVNDGEIYVVGSNKLTNDFDDNLLGMVPDEEREFDIMMNSFVMNTLFRKEHVHGENCEHEPTRTHVKVKLHMGMKSVPCSDNEELAKKANYESYQKLREAATGSATSRIQQNRSFMIGNQIKIRLVESHDFEVPSWLTLMEAQNIAVQEGIKWDEIANETREPYIKRAKERVKLSCIFDSIRKTEPEAQMSDEEVKEYLTRLFTMQGQDAQKGFVEAERTGKLLGMISAVRDEITTQWLVKNSKVVE
jgi:trigger factor